MDTTSTDIFNAILESNVDFVASMVQQTDKLGNINALNVEMYRQKRNGDTPLHLAARMGSCNMLKLLLKVFNLNITNNDGKSPLHEAAAAGQHEAVELLLSMGASIDPLKRADWTPLMMACTKNSLLTVNCLLEYGASPVRTNKDGWNSFHIASREGNIAIMDRLFKADSTCWNTKSKNRRTPLHTVALHGHTKALEHLLTQCDYDVNEQDSCGSTPLNDALRKGHINVAKILLKNGAFTNIPDVIGRLPIHIVAESGQIASLNLLVELKTDTNSRCNGGSAPLHLAAKEGHVSMLDSLLKHGADCFATDERNRTALTVAKGCKKEDCSTFLYSYMVKNTAHEQYKTQCHEQYKTPLMNSIEHSA